MRKQTQALLLVAALVAAACRTSEEQEAYREGVAAAREDIAAGRPRICMLGLPKFERGWLDDETGLPRFPLGCVVNDASKAWKSGYNETVRDALDGGDLAGLTFAHKITAREAVQARFAAEDAPVLRLGGPVLDVPGGRYRVHVAPRFGKPEDTPYLFVTDSAGEERSRELHWLGGSEARVLFDHDGTTLLVRDDAAQTFNTFDLPTGIFLQGFPDRLAAPPGE